MAGGWGRGGLELIVSVCKVVICYGLRNTLLYPALLPLCASPSSSFFLLFFLFLFFFFSFCFVILFILFTFFCCVFFNFFLVLLFALIFT